MSIAARLAAFAHNGTMPRGLPSDAAPIAAADDGFTVHDGGPRAVAGRDPRASAITAALGVVLGSDPARAPLFFDLETTGLGSDAVPFVVGLAGFADHGAAWVRQWQLADLAGERSMWLSVLDTLRERSTGALLVTYNGASFDRTIVRLRLRRLGLWTDALAQMFGAHHFDLLPVCRRLWRGVLPDLRLLTLERRILGTVRVGDPSGLEIAELGQRWVGGVRDATTVAGVAAVRRHNADDLLGLASLIQSCATAITSPSGVMQALGVARHLRRRDDAAADAIALLEAWRRRALVDRAHGVELLLLLVAMLRKAGELDQAHAVLVEICTHQRGHPDATTRLAIDCEHRLRRADLALEWLRTVTDPCPRRWARLLAKQRTVAAPVTAATPAIETSLDPPRVVPTGSAGVLTARCDAVPGSWRAAAARRAPAV